MHVISSIAYLQLLLMIEFHYRYGLDNLFFYYDSLHVFCSTTYYHVRESKLDPRAKKEIFLGFSLGIKRYSL